MNSHPELGGLNLPTDASCSKALFLNSGEAIFPDSMGQNGLGESLVPDPGHSKNSPLSGQDQLRIGNQQLPSSPWSLSFEKKQLSLESHCWNQEGPPLPLTRVNGSLMIPVSLGTHVVSALWDTGSPISVIGPRLHHIHRGSFLWNSRSSLGPDLVGSSERDIFLSDRVFIQGQGAKTSFFYIEDLRSHPKWKGLEIDMVLGMDTIQRFNWCFDPQKNQVVVQSVSTPST